MSLRKDKQKVIGENFDDERIKSFLDLKPAMAIDPDYHVLEKAYRGMKSDNFATFIHFFTQDGRNINAVNEQGQTFLSVITDHRHAEPYISILREAGAK